MPPGQVIVFFAGLIAIIFAAYYVTYYIGLKASGRSRGRLRNKNINIVDRFSISKDKSFCLVEIAGKVYVIGITNQTMTLIDTLDAAAFSEAAAEQHDKPLWQAGFNSRITGPMTKKLAAFLAKKSGRPLEEKEDFKRAAFSESMEAARRKNNAGRPGPIRAEDSGRTRDPGGAEDSGRTRDSKSAEGEG